MMNVSDRGDSMGVTLKNIFETTFGAGTWSPMSPIGYNGESIRVFACESHRLGPIPSSLHSRHGEDRISMPDLDAEMMVDQVVMLGLVSREQLREAKADAEDGSPDTTLRMLLRKGALTSWQVDRLKKGDPSGFFFGDSKVLFHLAEGTFARVYRGEHTTTKAALAIKVLRQRFASISEAVERFHKEAEAGIRLRHPNIVQIIDVGQQDHRHFMIMEYVEGMNLRDFMKLRSRIPSEQALPLMLGMARGLQYSLERGVTHRDIKGTNILISNSGVAKLVDFGLATMQSDETKPGVKSQRTVDYSALERTCKSPKGDPRSDIYFLGCVFYQMVTGQLPMEESESKDMLRKMLKRSFGAIKPINDHRYAPEEELGRIIEKMMKIDLKARYQNMDDVVADLERFEALDQVGRRPHPRTSSEAEQDDVESIFAAAEVPEPAHRRARPARRAAALRGQGRGCQERPVRRGPGRDPGCPAQGTHELGLSRSPGVRCRDGRRAVPRVTGRRRDLRHRRPGGRIDRRFPRHA